MYNKNILITNIGRRGYLVKFIKDMPSFAGKVFVSDCDKTASGLYGCNNGHFILSRPVDNPEKYVEFLIDLCKEHDINIIIPVIDPEIDILSKYRNKFKDNNVFVAVSSKEVLEICYDKSRMNEFLTQNGFSVPKTYFTLKEYEDDFTNKKINFPIILKPVFGSGSVSTYKISSIDELRCLWAKGMMIQEFIDGQEYGIDTFNDLNGLPVRCVVKKKISMRSGETDKALIVKNEMIQKTIINLAIRLGHICNLDCDVLVKDNWVYVIDLNPRFGGGYPATHMSGENYLELIMKLASGGDLQEDFESYQAGILVMKEVSLVTTEVQNYE